MLRVDLGQASGFPNGRQLADKTTDAELGLLLCTLSGIGDLAGLTGPDTNEPGGPLPKQSGGVPVFPYLEPPGWGRAARPTRDSCRRFRKVATT